jgi:hypothetical protein
MEKKIIDVSQLKTFVNYGKTKSPVMSRSMVSYHAKAGTIDGYNIIEIDGVKFVDMSQKSGPTPGRDETRDKGDSEQVEIIDY